MSSGVEEEGAGKLVVLGVCGMEKKVIKRESKRYTRQLVHPDPYFM